VCVPAVELTFALFWQDASKGTVQIRVGVHSGPVVATVVGKVRVAECLCLCKHKTRERTADLRGLPLGGGGADYGGGQDGGWGVYMYLCM